MSELVPGEPTHHGGGIPEELEASGQTFLEECCKSRGLDSLENGSEEILPGDRLKGEDAHSGDCGRGGTE